MTDVAERFWAKVDKAGACWLWVGARNEHGYGRFGVQRKNRHAHRVAWELTHGPIPERLCVCHTCDTPACVNPGHLFLGTMADNTQDMIRKGRRVQARLRGEANPASKLSAADVIAIRNRYRRGTPGVVATDGLTAIARDYGLNIATVSGIVNRTRWCHI